MPNSNSHNGGWLGFSPIDGYLYVTTGDGGANQGADNGLPSQDPFDFHGKILRVDVSGDDFPADDDRNYTLPPDNAFDGTNGAPEVYALGLRHPFRASFDSQTGDLYIGDVGSSFYDEINVLPADAGAGLNFGWRAREGSFDNPIVSDPSPLDPVDPIYEYENLDGASVTGGVVYRGAAMPGLQGTYFFGDFVQDDFISFRNVDGVAIDIQDREQELFPDGFGGLSSFGEDGLGEIYVTDLFRSDVWRIVFDGIDGDFNDDGVVDAADYTVWRDAGVRSEEQYDLWAANFGQTAAPSTSAPEPTALVLLAIGLGVLAARHRR